uniref:Myosin motor domain-containing protein n=1 Tax=Macrostomum lignano TaxID=282301 RepID=A0A1I8FLI0_9PLAT
MPVSSSSSSIGATDHFTRCSACLYDTDFRADLNDENLDKRLSPLSPSHSWTKVAPLLNRFLSAATASREVARLLAGILLLARLPITTSSGARDSISDKLDENSPAEFLSESFADAEAAACSGLGLSEAGQLLACLAGARIESGRGSVFVRACTIRECAGRRDAVCRFLYGSLFAYLVGRINRCIQAGDANDATASSTIGILDLYGFENFLGRNDRLRSTRPLWIRCLRPSLVRFDMMMETGAGWSDEDVAKQLESCGLLPATRAARRLHPVRLTYAEFLTRYGCLMLARARSSSSSPELAFAGPNSNWLTNDLPTTPSRTPERLLRRRTGASPADHQRRLAAGILTGRLAGRQGLSAWSDSGDSSAAANSLAGSLGIVQLDWPIMQCAALIAQSMHTSNGFAESVLGNESASEGVPGTVWCQPARAEPAVRTGNSVTEPSDLAATTGPLPWVMSTSRLRVPSRRAWPGLQRHGGEGDGYGASVSGPRVSLPNRHVNIGHSGQQRLLEELADEGRGQVHHKSFTGCQRVLSDAPSEQAAHTVKKESGHVVELSSLNNGPVGGIVQVRLGELSQRCPAG